MLIVEEGLAQAKTATKALFGDHHCLRSLSSESCSIFSPPTITSFSPGDELLQLFRHVPTTQLNLDLLNNHPTVGEIAVQASVVPSKCKSISEYHHQAIYNNSVKVVKWCSSVAVQQLLSTGGLYVNGERASEKQTFAPSLHMLPGNITVFRVGKKNHHLVQWIC